MEETTTTSALHHAPGADRSRLRSQLARGRRAVGNAVWTRSAAWLFLAFLAVAVAAVSLISRFALDPVASREAADQLGRIANESAAVTDRYLGSAESVVNFAVSAVPSLPADDDALLGKVFVAALEGSSNLSAVYVGYPNGEFAFAGRTSETDETQWRTRFIRLDADGHRGLKERWLDSEFIDVRDPFVGEADYDPRDRPWYQGLPVPSATSAWSEPYVFFSNGEVGVTYSQPVYNADGSLQAVFGADLLLTELITFLRDRRPTSESRVQVIDESGRVLAAASMNPQNPVARAVTVPTLRAGSLLEISPTASPDGLTTATTALTLNPDWSLVVRADTTELMSATDAFRSGRAQLAGLLVAAGLAVALAVLGALGYVRALRRAAAVDTLTRLESRWGVTRSIRRHLRRGSGTTTLAIIDLDGFKAVNDQLGHPAGDRALQFVGDRLAAAMPERGLLGRLGGDEFVVVVSDPDQPDVVVSNIQKALSQPILLREAEVLIGASIGTTVTTKGENAQVSRLLREADLALYEAKAAGGRTSRAFDPDMERRKLEEVARRRRLEDGLENDEFCLYFQPEVDLRTGAIVGAEALLRWEVGAHRVEAAESFIDDLERFGLLDRVIDVLERDSVSLATQIERGLILRINIAADQIVDQRVLALVTTFSQRLPEIDLCLELTERSMLDATLRTRGAIDAIRASGVQIALDDFGTGFGSLKQLHDLPIDTIKIDRSFVADLDADEPDFAIASILIELGSLVGVAVVAEGIETELQYEALRKLGCTTGQGWLFAPALPADEFVDLLHRHNSAFEGVHGETQHHRWSQLSPSRSIARPV